MSCAPPPPPPPGPALAPHAGGRSNSSSAADGRGLLLESIRKGTKLKKAVTNDKSAPVLGGNNASVRSPTSGTSSSTIRTNANNNNNNNNSQRLSNDPPPSTGGLGNLFVNGIPRLRPTGLPIGQAYQQYRNETEPPKSISSVNSRLSSSNNVHNTNRNNGGNDSNSAYPNHHSTSSLTKVRGPPPQPPGPPPKRDHDTSTNGLVVHARSPSTVSLSENSYQNRVSNKDGHHPVHSHGKPSLAPKPPGSIARTQSMREPKSSLSVSENIKNESQFGIADQSDAYRMNTKNGFPSFHQSQESLSRRNPRSSSPPRAPSNAVSWGSSLNTGAATLRPYNRAHGSPLRAPLTKPPPPPSSRMAMSPPMCPPPPPPTHAPPPPPHRLYPAPPPPPSVVQNKHNANFSDTGAPPTPPTRYSSMQSSNSSKTMSFESRFISYFHNVEEFPPPQPFAYVKKIYNSKVQAKQQAPQPPVKALHQQNRTWQSSETTSKC